MRKNQNGFSVVETLIVIMVVAILGSVGFFVLHKKDGSQSRNSGNNKTAESKNKEPESESELKIFNLGISSLSDVNVTTDATREYTKSGHKGFYIFGDILPGTPVRHNPNFEFASMKEGTKLISAIDGIVGFVQKQQDSNDYEVFLMPKENSEWVIGYDHVTDLKVQKGDKVKVGDLIGYPARQGNGLLRFEFQINKNDGSSNDGMHICPVTLFDSSVLDSWTEQLRKTQDEWEKVSGLELYDTAKQEPMGCLLKEMTPAYAQGQTQ